MSNTPKTLAKGHALTPATFADFIERLRHHCRGAGVADHCTADAFFTVQSRRIVYGIDMDYTDKRAVCLEDGSWFSPQEYWDDADEELREKLNEEAQGMNDCDFLACNEDDQWSILGDLDDHTVTGYDEEWEHVNSHFTKEAAEAFIKRKAHDYPLGLRVYVDAQLYCWEFNTIKEALMDGRLVLASEVKP